MVLGQTYECPVPTINDYVSGADICISFRHLVTVSITATGRTVTFGVRLEADGVTYIDTTVVSVVKEGSTSPAPKIENTLAVVIPAVAAKTVKLFVTPISQTNMRNGSGNWLPSVGYVDLLYKQYIAPPP